LALNRIVDRKRKFSLFPVLLLVSALAATGPAFSQTGEKPQVIGYGVKPCEQYLSAFDGWEQGLEGQIDEYLGYRDWFTGLVTGLSLATAMDVLQGVEVNGAMRRIQVYCDEHPTDDFFTASMDLIRTLSSL
jgi:hypothetical protein